MLVWGLRVENADQAQPNRLHLKGGLFLLEQAFWRDCYLRWWNALQFMFASNQVFLFSIYTSHAATDGPGTCSLPEECVHSATCKLLGVQKRNNKNNL